MKIIILIILVIVMHLDIKLLKKVHQDLRKKKSLVKNQKKLLQQEKEKH